MIYSLSGDDDFTIRETLAGLKESVGTPDVRDVNIVTIGANVSLDEFTANASTVPFLADKRLVLVEGLLGKFERGRADAAPVPARTGRRSFRSGSACRWCSRTCPKRRTWCSWTDA